MLPSPISQSWKDGGVLNVLMQGVNAYDAKDSTSTVDDGLASQDDMPLDLR